MAEYGIPLAVVGLGAYAIAVLQFRFARHERPYIWACFAAHILSSFALVLLTRHYFGGGDMFAYQEMGLWLRRLLNEDFGLHAPEVLRLLLQQETVFEFHPLGNGATGSMSAITGLSLWLLGGSFYATNLFFGMAAFSGQLAIYVALRTYLPADTHKRLLVATLLVPSVVFWSSGVVKEALALAGLGWMVLAAVRFAHGRFRLSHVLLLVFGGTLVALFKPYILMPFFLAAGVAYYWRRAQVVGRRAVPTIRPLRLALAAVLAVGGVLVVGELFPRFAIENIAEEAARLQNVGQRIEGGSNYSIGDGSARSLAGQLAFAPWALISSMFRPFFFEARSLMVLVNAMETTAFLVLFLRIFRPSRWRQGVYRLASSPVLMFCIAFLVAFGIGVGLATTNLGTLSRYRMPMVPLYAASLLVLQPRRNAGSRPS